LRQTKEAEAREKEIDKICKENIEKLEKMSVDISNELISRGENGIGGDYGNIYE